MNLTIKKIKRGIIYHSLSQSFIYFFKSLYGKLDDEKKIIEFEDSFASYCKSDYCLAFPLARTAIHSILKSLNLPKGSEVIMSPISIKGILDVILDLELVPKYVDLDLETINFDHEELEKSITKASKVAIITNLFGLVPNMESIISILRKRNIFIIEDFSHGLNASFNGKNLGSFGDVGVYSSSSIKTLDTLGGGLVVTNKVDLHQKLISIKNNLFPVSRNFLIKKALINLTRNVATNTFIFSLFTFYFLQALRIYNPRLALKQTGNRNKNRLSKLPKIWFNKYSSIQACIGLEHINKCKNNDKKRIHNVNKIKQNVSKNFFPKIIDQSFNVYWQLLVLVPNAEECQKYLSQKGIDSASTSLELLSSLEDYPNKVKLPNAIRIYNNGILIPCYPTLKEEELEYICKCLQSFLNKIP
mgnify:CR=1 FL=1|tara:strand:- start:1164 stop:2411 length:1248 start_codon:yes stop_codon:yes gene_type:complete